MRAWMCEAAVPLLSLLLQLRPESDKGGRTRKTSALDHRSCSRRGVASEPVAMSTCRCGMTSDQTNPDSSISAGGIREALRYTHRLQKYAESSSRWLAACYLLVLRVMVGCMISHPVFTFEKCIYSIYIRSTYEHTYVRAYIHTHTYIYIYIHRILSRLCFG